MFEISSAVELATSSWSFKQGQFLWRTIAALPVARCNRSWPTEVSESSSQPCSVALRSRCEMTPNLRRVTGVSVSGRVEPKHDKMETLRVIRPSKGRDRFTTTSHFEANTRTFLVECHSKVGSGISVPKRLSYWGESIFASQLCLESPEVGL